METKGSTNVVTEHYVSDSIVNVWHPTEYGDGFSISLKHGDWLVGLYDSVESALAGAECDLRTIPEFYEMQKRVNYFDMENRLISLEDLNLVKNINKCGAAVKSLVGCV